MFPLLSFALCYYVVSFGTTTAKPVITGCSNSTGSNVFWPINGIWSDLAICGVSTIQRCEILENDAQTMSLNSNECKQFHVNEMAGSDWKCPDDHFLESITYTQSPCNRVQLKCCKPANEWTVILSTYTNSEWLSTSGQKCPEMTVAVGLDWSGSSSICRTFSLICASVEAKAAAGKTAGYWAPICSSACDDQNCPFGGEVGVFREREDHWNKQFVESIYSSLENDVTFQNKEILLMNNLVDSTMELARKGHNFQRETSSGLTSKRTPEDCEENVWWQWMIDVEDISLSDDRQLKIYLRTPNFWLTNSFALEPKCMPGDCADENCQNCKVTVTDMPTVPTPEDKCKEPGVSETSEKISTWTSAEQSTTHSNYLASLALDGNFATFSHTGELGNDPYPWWRVDLGEQFRINSVGIRVRHDHYQGGERLHYFEIRVGNFDPYGMPLSTLITQNQLCFYYDGKDLKYNTQYSWNCVDPNPVGRYVSVQVIKFCPTCIEPNINYVIMAEVQVNGFKCK